MQKKFAHWDRGRSVDLHTGIFHAALVCIFWCAQCANLFPATRKRGGGSIDSGRRRGRQERMRPLSASQSSPSIPPKTTNIAMSQFNQLKLLAINAFYRVILLHAITGVVIAANNEAQIIILFTPWRCHPRVYQCHTTISIIDRSWLVCDTTINRAGRERGTPQQPTSTSHEPNNQQPKNLLVIANKWKWVKVATTAAKWMINNNQPSWHGDLHWSSLFHGVKV